MDIVETGVSKKTELFRGDAEDFVVIICKFLSANMVVNHARINGKMFGQFVTMKGIKLCSFDQTFRGAKLAELYGIHLYLDNSVPNDSIEFRLNKIITHTEMEKQAVARVQRMDESLEKTCPMVEGKINDFFKKRGQTLDEIMAEVAAYKEAEKARRVEDLKFARDAAVSGERVPLIAR